MAPGVLAVLVKVRWACWAAAAGHAVRWSGRPWSWADRPVCGSIAGEDALGVLGLLGLLPVMLCTGHAARRAFRPVQEGAGHAGPGAQLALQVKRKFAFLGWLRSGGGACCDC
jgi:hypothetical protein